MINNIFYLLNNLFGIWHFWIFHYSLLGQEISTSCDRIEIYKAIFSFTQRRQWHPTPVLLPGKSHGQRSLVGCSPWGRWESDTQSRTHWATLFSLFTFTYWRRKSQPTPVFLPGESQGWESLVGFHLWDCTESDMTEAT